MKKKKVTKWVAADMLWAIYHEACACAMDHGSVCDCRAGDQAAAFLEIMLGKKWHKKMLRRQAE
jgi:hypothetical protein